MSVASPPAVVEFPLRGEWVAPNTPGKKVPSHGTDMLGQRFAFDFVRTDPNTKGMKFYRPSSFVYMLRGVRLKDCYGWGQPFYSPVSGMVVEARDGWAERKRVHLLRDLAVVLKNGLMIDLPRMIDLRPLVGNYVIIECDPGYVFLAHARCGSIQVREAEAVSVGQLLGQVGHSGNSTAPHLHFQLMDTSDLRKASGLPCCFREYEALQDGAWRIVRNGIPNGTERLRKL